MLQKTFSALTAAILLANVVAIQTAWGQPVVPGLVPHVDLSATFDGGAAMSPTRRFNPNESALIYQLNRPAADDKLFADAPTEERGWKALAHLLEALTPGIDTALPLSPSQITDRITAMLNAGQNHEALAVTEKTQAQIAETDAIGNDVQLMFLHARALSGLDRSPEAIEIYRAMTVSYPELPEPWNNLAAEYVKQGKLEMALDALQMALTANPRYASAIDNLGRVRMMLAEQSFTQAASMGVAGSGDKARKVQDALVGQ